MVQIFILFKWVDMGIKNPLFYADFKMGQFIFVTIAPIKS
jgi:hypothetical protein